MVIAYLLDRALAPERRASRPPAAGRVASIGSFESPLGVSDVVIRAVA